jgi:hypothetical protein
VPPFRENIQNHLQLLEQLGIKGNTAKNDKLLTPFQFIQLLKILIGEREIRKLENPATFFQGIFDRI